MGSKPESVNESIQHALGRLLHHEYSRQFWLLQIGGWLGLSVVGFLSLNLWYNQPELGYLGHTLLQSAVGLLVSWPLRPIYRSVWSWSPVARVVAIAVSVLLASSIWAFLRLVLFEYMTGEAGLMSDFGGWLYPSIFIFLCWTALYHGFKYYRLAELEHSALQDMAAAKNREAFKAAQARSSAREAELTMLRYQLNPHFLFNTLNALQSLVASRQTERASQMIASLSDFLRYSLYTDTQDPVTVAEEFLAIERYLEIEQARFRDRLSVSIQISPEAARELIPSMLLQPLVENAIKHAVSKSEEPSRLKIAAFCSGHALELQVSDSGDGSASADPIDDTGVGLRNIRQRLDGSYGAAASLRHERRADGGVTARICIPLQRQLAYG
ncbi:MAG: histidine kinase [Pseudomonadota bacterium]